MGVSAGAGGTGRFRRTECDANAPKTKGQWTLNDGKDGTGKRETRSDIKGSDGYLHLSYLRPRYPHPPASLAEG